MPRNYLPGSDSGLLDWSRNFAEQIAAAPEVFGLTPAQAAEYAQEQRAFAEAYRVATDPATRGTATVFAKNQQRQALVRISRELARYVMGTPGMGNAQRIRLGLNPKRRAGDSLYRPRKRIPRPDHAPALLITGIRDGCFTVRLENTAQPERKGRPVDVAAAQLMRYIGDDPPSNPRDWEYMGNRIRVRLLEPIPGGLGMAEQVWFVACWINARGEAGPYSRPSKLLQGVTNGLGQGVQPNAQAMPNPLRLAA